MSSIRRDKILQEPIKSVVVGKAFHVYQQRNEWVNWNGSTDVVNRSWTSIYLSLKDAEQFAEKSRTRGTRFVIDELPYICALSESGALAITELFSEKPMGRFLHQNNLSANGRTIQGLKELVKNSEWAITQIFEEHPSIVPLDSIYFSRTSSPGKNFNSLGWSLGPRKINEKPILELANNIKEALL